MSYRKAIFVRRTLLSRSLPSGFDPKRSRIRDLDFLRRAFAFAQFKAPKLALSRIEALFDRLPAMSDFSGEDDLAGFSMNNRDACRF